MFYLVRLLNNSTIVHRQENSMSRLLQIHSSIFEHEGQSSRLAREYVQRWRAAHPDGEIRLRDLAADPLPHLDAKRFAAFLAGPGDRDSQQQAIVAESDALIDELRWADEIVIGLPMYNLGVPSQLKAWFDHIARAGTTFRYTPDGPQGLLEDKPVRLFASRGGQYVGTAHDSQTQHVKDFLGLLGFTQLHFVYAEQLAMGESEQTAALAQAHAEIQRLVA
jgi:FMN-dependent NADH-azoreductase